MPEEMKTVAPATELDSKDELRGAVLVVEGFEREAVQSTLPGSQPGQTFDILRCHVDGEPDKLLIASGQVMSKIARATGFPFRAKLVMPRGKRYWTFEPV